MITNNLIQGTPEWHAHRATHFNASDAPAMMGCSAYKTRNQLLHELHTSITPEVDAATQRRFDEGHRIEALARPLAEEIIGMQLYPVTGSEGKLSASFDGLTMCETIAFEHKSLNDELRSAFSSDGSVSLPLMYTAQMEQQLMVSGAEKVLFMASKWAGDELVEERHCWYESNHELRQNIIQGWAQFATDLANYAPVEVVPAAVATPTIGLPAVSIQVSGSISLADNLDMFGQELKAYIARVNIKPITDQDFADLDGAAKTMKRAEDQLEAAESNALAQTASIDLMRRTVANFKDLARTNRLLFERLFKAEKENRKLAIVQAAKTAFDTHLAALNTRLGKPYMPAVSADFAGVTKGLKTITSMQNALDTETARAKIEANAIADKIQANLATLADLGSDYKHLFADTAQIVQKAPDDLTALVKSRIADFQASEAARIEKERERIRAEEVAKLEKEAVLPARIDQAPPPVPAIAQPMKATAPQLSAPATAYKTRPTDAQLIEVLTLHFRVHESKVIEWLCDMDLSEASEAMAASI